MSRRLFKIYIRSQESENEQDRYKIITPSLLLKKPESYVWVKMANLRENDGNIPKYTSRVTIVRSVKQIVQLFRNDRDFFPGRTTR